MEKTRSKRGIKYKENNKVVSPFFLLIDLNVNVLNSPNKRQRFSDKKNKTQDLALCCL